MIYEIRKTDRVSSLFGQWEETLIWSCLQQVMGKIYADDPDRPASAMAVLGDFFFFAGRPDPGLVSYSPDQYDQRFRIMVPQDGRWLDMIVRSYGERARVVSRYAIKKEPDVFDKENLMRMAASLPTGYRLSMIDERAYLMCREEAWSRDLVAQFPDYGTFRALGLGAVVWKDGRIVSGASSYSRYWEGIEIEIDTKEGCRRKGLAQACGAKLILACLERGLYPSWDAQNTGSVALAQKLGYHYSHTYPAVEVHPGPFIPNAGSPAPSLL